MKTQASRTVCYSWTLDDSEAPGVDASVEYEIDDHLKQEQADGFVVDFDTGRGRMVWFTAAPGRRARALRDWVASRLPPAWRQGE